MCFTLVSVSSETPFGFFSVLRHNACVSHACLGKHAFRDYLDNAQFDFTSQFVSWRMLIKKDLNAVRFSINFFINFFR